MENNIYVQPISDRYWFSCFKIRGDILFVQLCSVKKRWTGSCWSIRLFCNSRNNHHLLSIGSISSSRSKSREKHEKCTVLVKRDENRIKCFWESWEKWECICGNKNGKPKIDFSILVSRLENDPLEVGERTLLDGKSIELVSWMLVVHIFFCVWK